MIAVVAQGEEIDRQRSTGEHGMGAKRDAVERLRSRRAIVEGSRVIEHRAAPEGGEFEVAALALQQGHVEREPKIRRIADADQLVAAKVELLATEAQERLRPLDRDRQFDETLLEIGRAAVERPFDRAPAALVSAGYLDKHAPPGNRPQIRVDQRSEGLRGIAPTRRLNAEIGGIERLAAGP